MTIEERMNEISQAYCTERNSHKEMDSELIEDVKVIAIRIAKEYAEEMCKRQREICAEAYKKESLIMYSEYYPNWYQEINEAKLATEEDK